MTVAAAAFNVYGTVSFDASSYSRLVINSAGSINGSVNFATTGNAGSGGVLAIASPYFNLDCTFNAGTVGVLAFVSTGANVTAAHTLKAGTYTMAAIAVGSPQEEGYTSATLTTSGETTLNAALMVYAYSKVVIQHNTTVAAYITAYETGHLHINGGALVAASATFDTNTTYELDITSTSPQVLTTTGSVDLTGNIKANVDTSVDLTAGVTVLKYASHTSTFASLSVSTMSSKRATTTSSDSYTVTYGDKSATMSQDKTDTSSASTSAYCVMLVLSLISLFFF